MKTQKHCTAEYFKAPCLRNEGAHLQRKGERAYTTRIMNLSVIIPTYNRAHCIKKAIDSVIAQTVQPQELIIVDDGSTDNLEAVLASYSAPFIKQVRHPKNKGASAARNTGILAATCEYLAFLDSDDRWHKNKLETQIAFMKKNKLDICCSNFSLYRNGVLKSTIAYRPYTSIRLTSRDIAWGCFIAPGSTLICKKDLLETIRGYDITIPRAEDWDLLIRLSQHHDIGWLNQPLAEIYVESSGTGQGELQGLSHIKSKIGYDIPLDSKKRILASYWFQLSAIHLKQKHYARFLGYLALSLAKKPFNHFPLKAILLPKLFKGLKSYP